LKNSTKRKWKKGITVRAAALTFFVTILLVYSVGVYLFSDFVFLQDNRDAATPSAMYMSPAAQIPPMLDSRPHREYPGKTGAADEKNTYGYTRLPLSMADSAREAVALLAAAGVPYEVRYTWSAEPEGTLVYFDYAGLSDENGYYINPAVPVVLTLSGNKLPQPAYDGTNRVYLTFDDGPTAYTERILDTLGRYGVQATFFTLGKSVEKYPAAAVRITEDGHLLASHGTTHEYESIYANTEALLADVRRWQNIVTSAGALPEGAKLHFRFPGGSVGSYFGEAQRQAMIDGLHSMGYRIFDWNILSNDGVLYMRPEGMSTRTYWKQTFTETWKNCTSGTKIILLHDSTAETADLLPWLIHYVVSEGYTFGTLDQLETEYFMK